MDSAPRSSGHRRRIRMLSGPAVIGVLVASSALVAGCRTRSFHAKSASSGSTSFALPKSFCEAVAPQGNALLGRRNEVGHLWSAGEVQAHISALVASPLLSGWPWSSYAVAYKKMTAGRDAARCDPSHPMFPKDPLDRALNDALADVMTRTLVNVSADCAARGDRGLTEEEKKYVPQTRLYQADLGGLWCSLFAQARADNWDSIRFAMASTGLYLTINLGYAISALPQIDALWNPALYPDYKSRVDRLEKFRPSYDSFNVFLANNLDTVATALTSSGLVQCKLFDAAAALGEYLPVFDDVFAFVRTPTFDIGVKIARAAAAGTHPLVQPVVDGQGNTTYAIRTDLLQANVLARNERLENATGELVRLGVHVRKAFGTPLFRVFGGITFAEAKAMHAGGESLAACAL